jgi:hypothetical protein
VIEVFERQVMLLRPSATHDVHDRMAGSFEETTRLMHPSVYARELGCGVA